MHTRSLPPSDRDEAQAAALTPVRFLFARLPAVTRRLTELAVRGYEFCAGCERVTERDARGGCGWCGSSEVRHVAAVFEEVTS